MSTVKTVRRQDPARTLSGLCQDSVRTLSGLCQDCQDRCGRSTNQVGYRPQHGRGDTRGATAAERVFKAPQVGEAVDLRILAPLGANESVGGNHVVT